MSITLEEIHSAVSRYLEQHPDEDDHLALLLRALDTPTPKLAAKLANG